MNNAFTFSAVIGSLAFLLVRCGGSTEREPPVEPGETGGASAVAAGASTGSGGAAATGPATSASSTAASTTGSAGGAVDLPPCVDSRDCRMCSAAISLLCGPVCEGDSQTLFDSLAECACNGPCQASCSDNFCSASQVTQDCIDCIDMSCQTQLADCGADA